VQPFLHVLARQLLGVEAHVTDGEDRAGLVRGGAEGQLVRDGEGRNLIESLCKGSVELVVARVQVKQALSHLALG